MISGLLSRICSFPKTSILLLALLLRVVVFIPVAMNQERIFTVGTDSYDYHMLAKNLTEQGVFSNSGEGSYPNSYRSPLYPLFIASVYSLWGEKPLLVIIAQLLISLISCIAVYELGKVASDEKTGLIAGLLYAADTGAIGYSSVYQSETLFTLLFILSIYYFVRFTNEPNRMLPIFLSSAFLGAATLCRSISLYFPPVILITVFALKSHDLEIRLKHLVVFLATFLLITGLWGIRNYIHFESLFFTTISEYNLLFCFAAEVKADSENRDFYVVREELRRKYDLGEGGTYGFVFLNDRDTKLVEKRKQFVAEALKIISENPALSVKRYIYGRIYALFFPLHGPVLANIWGPKNAGTRFFSVIKNNGEGSLIRQESFWLKISIILAGLLYTFFIYVGIFFGMGIKKKSVFHFLFVAIALYFAVITISGPVSLYPRFRYPLMPFLAILAAMGYVYRYHKKPMDHGEVKKRS